MSAEIVPRDQELIIWQAAVEQQRRQAEINQYHLNEVIEIKRDICEIRDEVRLEFDAMRQMVQEVRDSVTLSDIERFELVSAVASKSIQFAKEYFGEEKPSSDAFKCQVGKFRRGIWKKLKYVYQVAKYSHIRRVDFESARDFIQTMTISQFIDV